MFLENTAGMNSRRRILDEDQVKQIRKEYDSGLRGKERAWIYKISPRTYDQIGRRLRWKSLPEEKE
jgi:hypothetical protein